MKKENNAIPNNVYVSTGQSMSYSKPDKIQTNATGVYEKRSVKVLSD